MKNLVAVCLLFLAPLIYAQDKMQTSADDKKPAHHAGAADFKNDVQKLAEEWQAAFKAKDVDKVAALYADDAVWVNPDGTFHGTGDIKGEVKKMLDRGDVVENLKTTKAMRSGDLGFAEGTYTGKPPAHGMWAITLKNKDGKWLLATDTDFESPRAGAMAKEGMKSK